MEWTRVKDKVTGHHYSVTVVDPERHTVLKQPATTLDGRPLPAKPRVQVTRPDEAEQATTPEAPVANPKEK